MVESTDIVYVFSGGPSNNNPANSLGGEPSSVSIGSGINNLFPDVTNDQSIVGHTDYRCFYIFNNNADDSFYGTELSIFSQTADGSDFYIGVTTQDEIQNITIDGTVTSGSLTLSYDSEVFSFDYDADVSTWASNLQTAINGFDVLSGVTVLAATIGDATIFECTFTGADGNRYHPLLEVQSNDLLPEPEISISKLVSGSPINVIAEDIDVGTTIPSGIVFNSPTPDSPISVGTLKPTEGFPIWVMRDTPPGTDPLATDTAKIRFNGSPI